MTTHMFEHTVTLRLMVLTEKTQDSGRDGAVVFLAAVTWAQ